MRSTNTIITLQTKRRQRAERFLRERQTWRKDFLIEQDHRLQELIAAPPDIRAAYFALLDRGLTDVFPPTLQRILREVLSS